MAKEKERYELRVGEIYRDIEKGMREIEADLAQTGKARLSNLATPLLTRWAGAFGGKKKKLELFFRSEDQRAELGEAAKGVAEESAELTSLWFQEFIGERLHMGEVLTDTGLWHLLYRDDGEVRRLMSNTDGKFQELAWQKNPMMRLEGDHLFATVYDRHEGLKAIHERAKTAEVFRATVLPPYLLKDVIPYAKAGDYRLILSRRDPLAKFFPDDSNVRYASRAKVFYVYGEEEASVGSVRLDGDFFSIFWRGNDVYSIMRFDNRDVANRLSKMFDTAWKYSEKV